MPKSVLFDREKVVEDVMELFWRKGYNGTSMQDLVDVTGLNRSSLYNSFGDKFSLFQEAMTHYRKIQNEDMNRLIANSKSPKEAIESLFKGISKEVALGEATKGCFLSNCTSELGSLDDKVKNFLVENKDQMVLIFQNLISQAQKNGEIDPSKNAKHLALFLFSSINGLRITSLIETDIQGVTDQILNSL